jgi:aryl-alcohol dehydrogenase-like predicted oxidoreductase
VRHIGLSNETPYGVHEFVRLAEQHGLPRVASVQNPYCLVNRRWTTAWTKPAPQGVSLLAYSPLGFGLLTGKYDATGIDPATGAETGRMAQV